MADLALVVVAAALVSNLVLVQSLGVAALPGAAQRLDDAFAISVVTGVILLTAAAVGHVVERYLLLPFGAPYLRLIAFVVAVVIAARATTAIVRRFARADTRIANVDADLLIVNGAVLGVALLNAAAGRSFVASLCYAFGAALGFGLVLVLFAGLRERIARADAPRPFRGPAITFVTAGILSLAFLGFAGFARL